MAELILLENPRRKRRRNRYNPAGFDNLGNPIFLEGGRQMRNPRRRSRNPKALALPGTMREWTQGVGVMDAAAAAGGLAASTMIPGMIIKDSVTTGQKIMKLLVSLGAAIGAGALGRAMVSPGAGKAAMIGGVAGTAAQAIGMFTNIQIGQQSRAISGRPTSRRLGETVTVSPATTREGETVSVILP